MSEVLLPIFCAILAFFAGLFVDASYRPTRDEIRRMIDERITQFHLELLKEGAVYDSHLGADNGKVTFE